LHNRLQTIDPLAAAKIHPRDGRRVVRALEVFEATGKPLSTFWREQEPGVTITVAAVTRQRVEIYDRINRRVLRMLDEDGVLDEARRVMSLSLSHTASQVHGLPFLAPYVRGELSREQTVTAWQQQVRNYAKRQLTWFRAEPMTRWVELKRGDTISLAAERIVRVLDGQTSHTGAA
jgi:tRNA dimethylallyltransferase